MVYAFTRGPSHTGRSLARAQHETRAPRTYPTEGEPPWRDGCVNQRRRERISITEARRKLTMPSRAKVMLSDVRVRGPSAVALPHNDHSRDLSTVGPHSTSGTRTRRHRFLGAPCSALRRRRFAWFGRSCSPPSVTPMGSKPAPRSDVPGSDRSVYVHASRKPSARAARQTAPYRREHAFLLPSVDTRAMLQRPVPSHTRGPEVTTATPTRVPSSDTRATPHRAPASSRRRWRWFSLTHRVASFTVIGRRNSRVTLSTSAPPRRIPRTPGTTPPRSTSRLRTVRASRTPLAQVPATSPRTLGAHARTRVAAPRRGCASATRAPRRPSDRRGECAGGARDVDRRRGRLVVARVVNGNAVLVALFLFSLPACTAKAVALAGPPKLVTALGALAYAHGLHPLRLASFRMHSTHDAKPEAACFPHLHTSSAGASKCTLHRPYFGTASAVHPDSSQHTRARICGGGLGGGSKTSASWPTYDRVTSHRGA